MRIKILKNLNKKGVLVLIIKEKDSIKNHPLWDFFNISDKNYILNFLQNNAFTCNSFYNFLLPSGRELILVGEVQRDKFNHRRVLMLARKIIYQAKIIKKSNLIFYFNDFKFNSLLSDLDLAFILSVQFEMANFEFLDYKTSKESVFINEIGILVDTASNKNLLNKYFFQNQILGQEINAARRLSNMPGGDMTPKKLVQAV